MPTFTLNVSFTAEQLNAIYATGNNVILAKDTNANKTNVAWLVFKPFQKNTVQWEEQYGIYASSCEVNSGVTITSNAMAPFPAVTDKLYTLDAQGEITGPEDGGQANAYSIVNDFNAKPYMTVGLYQDAMVNGTVQTGKYLNAIPLLFKSTAFMKPLEPIYIWLQSQITSGTIISTTTSPVTKLNFGGSVDQISVKYDSATGTFIQDNQSQLSANSADSDGLIEHIMPTL